MYNVFKVSLFTTIYEHLTNVVVVISYCSLCYNSYQKSIIYEAINICKNQGNCHSLRGMDQEVEAHIYFHAIQCRVLYFFKWDL